MAIKKTELRVDIFGDELKRKSLKAVSKLRGIDQLSVDGEKLTVIGEVCPCLLIKKLKKAGRSAQILSVGPPKTEKPNNPLDTTPPPPPPCPCSRVIIDYYDGYEPGFGRCTIL